MHQNGDGKEIDEFSEQMRSLAAEAAEHAEEGSARRALPMIIKALRPLMLGIEALSRATRDNTDAIRELKEAADSQKQVPQLMNSVREEIDQKQAINQQLFDALHSELQQYKDGFLLEVLQKPIIQDLIELFDDLSVVERQLRAHTGGDAEQERESLQTIHDNLVHTRVALVEVLERMEVSRMRETPGKLDKKTQRAVSVAPADSAQEDLDIVNSLRPGFIWKDRIVRPEEVVIKKWKEGYLMAMPEGAAATTSNS